MLKRIVSPAFVGGKGLLLVVLVGFLSWLLGVFVGFTVHGLGFGKVFAEQGQGTGDREMGRWGDGEREGQWDSGTGGQGGRGCGSDNW